MVEQVKVLLLWLFAGIKCVKPLKCSKKIICTFLYYFMIFYQLNLKQWMGCQHLLLWSTYQSMVTVYSSHYRQTFKEFCPSLNPPHGLLEIKCPVNPLANCMYLKRIENGYHLKDTYKYYYQMITQVAVTGLEWCHFFVWRTEESHLELLRFNADIWQDMKEKIDLFFFNHF